jgi:hypothetical protein
MQRPQFNKLVILLDTVAHFKFELQIRSNRGLRLDEQSINDYS